MRDVVLSQETQAGLTDRIAQVRKLAHVQLIRFSRLAADDCTESYLFQDDRFCGIRFSLGLFHAKWFEGDSQIEFFREGQTLMALEIEGTAIQKASIKKAA